MITYYPDSMISEEFAAPVLSLILMLRMFMRFHSKQHVLKMLEINKEYRKSLPSDQN